MAAALTYYTMLSLAPTLIIAIAIAGYLFGDRLAEAQVLETVQQFTTEEIARTVAGLIDRANRPDSGVLAGSISIAILVDRGLGRLHPDPRHLQHDLAGRRRTHRSPVHDSEPVDRDRDGVWS
jgi:hypothetical protein